MHCQEKTFVRDHFADAVHCLASLSAGEGEAKQTGLQKLQTCEGGMCV